MGTCDKVKNQIGVKEHLGKSADEVPFWVAEILPDNPKKNYEESNGRI